MFSSLLKLLISRVSKSEKGQDLAEYGLLVGFIALLVVAAVILFGQNLLAFFNNLGTGVAW